MNNAAYSYRLVDQSDPEIDALGQLLDDYNTETVGPANKRLLAVLVHNVNYQLIAGLSGHTAWGWLFVRWLWVRADSRGQGIASHLLELAEHEAKERGCVGAHIDTFNPQARCIYENKGFREFGNIPDFVNGEARSFLQKRWS